MSRPFLFPAALSGGLAVVLGAFGAHALKPALSREMIAVWETAVRYQMWHALGLGLIACLGDNILLRWSGRLMTLGILLFCGSLYLLALTGARLLGMITPFGGLAFIAAWILLACYSWRRRYDA